MSKQEPMPESREFPIDDITEFAYAKSADMKEETFFTVLGTAVVYLRQLLANIKDLKAENKELKPLQKVCGVCWTSSFEPTEDGERCLCCWQHKSIIDLMAENKKLREAGNFLSSEYVEVVESNCDCERYTDVIGQVEEAVTKEEFAGMSLPIKCGLCEWADALSKDKEQNAENAVSK